MAEDIREFLSTLERNGQLLRVKHEIDPLDDMGAFIARADYNHLDKAILFENPKGFDIPVLANTVGGNSHARIASTFGVPVEGAVAAIAKKMGQALQTGGIKPRSTPRSALRLSPAEREEISRGLLAGESCRHIAARLHRQSTRGTVPRCW